MGAVAIGLTVGYVFHHRLIHWLELPPAAEQPVAQPERQRDTVS